MTNNEMVKKTSDGWYSQHLNEAFALYDDDSGPIDGVRPDFYPKFEELLIAADEQYAASVAEVVRLRALIAGLECQALDLYDETCAEINKRKGYGNATDCAVCKLKAAANDTSA